MNQNELMSILAELDRLSAANRQSDMPHRIELCERALHWISKDSQPVIWAMLHDDLGSDLVLTLRGRRADNIEQAIQHYKLALEVRTCETRPLEWAATCHNLAEAYRQRILGEPADNIEQSIFYCNLALGVRTRTAHPNLWAMTQYHLAGAYYKRIRGERAENLEQAIQHCNGAQEVFAQQSNRYRWAQAENLLGEIYRARIRGTRLENIDESIQHLQNALKVHTRESFPEEWALLQNNLAAAYIERLSGTRDQNMEQALNCANQSLEVRTRKDDPSGWAMTQYNLGSIFRYRVQGDPAKNMEQSLHHFQQSLEVRTREAYPQDWAESHNNLGNTYLARLLGERTENIQKAIKHYEQALQVYTRSAFPEAWARSQHYLGNACLADISGEHANRTQREENTEKAIEHFEQALTVRTYDSHPKDWAETHNNLAGVYTKRKRGGARENIRQTIQHLEQALKVYTRQSFPQDWAGAQHNLAIAYAARAQAEREADIEQAISHYSEALQEYTDLALPNYRINTARALGNLAFEESRWELALKSYRTALDAQMTLLQSSFSRTSKQAELSQVQNLPARAAYACIQLGKYEQAVEVLEQGRAQLLRESMERQRQDLEQLTGLGLGHLYQEYMQAADRYAALQSASEVDRGEDWMRKMEQALTRIHSATKRIREEAGNTYPQYRHFLEALPFAEIQKLAQKHPLVYLSATPAGGVALVVTETGVHSLELSGLKQASLQKQIWRPSDEEIDRINTHLQQGMITAEDIQAVSGGYFSTYALWSLTRYLTNTSEELKKQLSDTWEKALDETARWLWDVGMGKLVAYLQGFSQAVTFIPAGHLAILPLHAAWVEDNRKPIRRRYVLDEINITYAPSAHALQQASLRAELPVESLLAVDNPDGTLDTSKEINTALHLFKQHTHLPGNEASVKAVKKAMQHASVLHFATHGRAGWQEEEQAKIILADGDLSLPDIFDLHLQRARLAVLSACETGVPGLKLIDEMIGLPAGMMQAGVPGVVGSLWLVDDRRTNILMKRFYKVWREGAESPSESLRQAQIWLRNSLSRSPYYWAAFTYTGV